MKKSPVIWKSVLALETSQKYMDRWLILWLCAMNLVLIVVLPPYTK